MVKKDDILAVLKRAFGIKVPVTPPVDISTLSPEELYAELEKGFADIKAGRTRPAEEVFADLRKRRNRN